jgi:hypothetical protein
MSLIELKAQYYDLIAQKQLIEKLMIETNQAIEAKMKEEQQTKVDG